jgi:hypothetical protein
LLGFREFIRVDFLVALKSKGMGEANEMAVPLATFPSTFDRGSFFFHLTDPADQHGPSNQFSIEGRGEDAKVRLQHLAELVVSEYASAKALRSAFEETSMAFAQRIRAAFANAASPTTAISPHCDCWIAPWMHKGKGRRRMSCGKSGLPCRFTAISKQY